MISFDVFLVGLMIVSTFTGLVTEAVKKILTEYNKKYCANSLAGIVAAVLSIAIGIGYMVLSGTGFTAQFVVCLIALAFMSWLGAMVGYDKIIGLLNNIKGDGQK